LAPTEGNGGVARGVVVLLAWVPVRAVGGGVPVVGAGDVDVEGAMGLGGGLCFVNHPGRCGGTELGTPLPPSLPGSDGVAEGDGVEVEGGSLPKLVGCGAGGCPGCGGSDSGIGDVAPVVGVAVVGTEAVADGVFVAEQSRLPWPGCSDRCWSCVADTARLRGEPCCMSSSQCLPFSLAPAPCPGSTTARSTAAPRQMMAAHAPPTRIRRVIRRRSPAQSRLARVWASRRRAASSTAPRGVEQFARC
jgi:hypothetical protein